MRANLISIGKMAELGGVTVPTLRLYDQLGLLKPSYVDPQSGYRYYSIHQNARLDMIAYMKELGMSLAEIADVLRREDITLIEHILSQKNEQLHQQMRELQARHEAVERAIASIERYRKSPTTGTISLEYIDQRYIYCLPCTENFYELGLESYENALADMRRQLMERGFGHVHSYNVGTTIPQADFEAGRFVPGQLFILLSAHDRHIPGVTTVDSGMHACIYLDCFDDEIACARRLLAYCTEQGYAISGDYFCEVLTEFNVFDSTTRSMFLRLQVPVSFR
ncbi:MAG: helix-turn-helix domain-containing protein [Candidatus Ventricola sp.]